jgi:hypothetical protein
MVGRVGKGSASTARPADGHGQAVHDRGAAMAIMDATRPGGTA